MSSSSEVNRHTHGDRLTGAQLLPMTTDKNRDVPFKMLEVWTSDGIQTPGISKADRHQQIEDISVMSSTPFPQDAASGQCDMPLHEEVIVVLFWFAMFGLLLYGPFVVVFILYRGRQFEILFIAMIFGFSYLFPRQFSPRACQSYLSTLILKYFSYRAIWQDYPDSSTPFIAVSPPHGLFPFGGIAGAIAIPR